MGAVREEQGAEDEPGEEGGSQAGEETLAPVLECPSAFALAEPGGKESASGEALARIDPLNLCLTPKFGEPLLVPFRDVAAVAAGDYAIRLSLSSKETLTLSRLGYRYEDFLRTLTRVRNELMLKDMLMEESLRKGGVDAEFAFLSSAGASLAGGRCQARLYDTALVLLPQFAEVFRLPYSEIASVREGDYALTLEMESGEKLTLSKLGRDFDPFKKALAEVSGELALKVQAQLKEFLPEADPAAIRRIARFMKEGKAARRTDIEGVSPALWAQLERSLGAFGIKEEYNFLKSLGEPRRICIGLKRGLVGDLTGDYVWFLVPVYSADPKKPGNALAMEATLGEGGGRATYFFQILSRQNYGRGASQEALDAAADELIRTVNRCMLAINFRREPIHLPEERLLDSCHAKYRTAIEKIPALRTLRGLFVGRVAHVSPAQWRRDVLDLLAFNVESTDDGERWAARAAVVEEEAVEAVEVAPSPREAPPAPRRPARVAAPEVAPLPPVSKGPRCLIEGLLIVHEDGRLIHAITNVGEQRYGDAELLSSMLSAVRSFIRDSMANQEVDELRFGDNTIRVERGRSFFVAAALFGDPDEAFQERLKHAVEKISTLYAPVLDAWDGDKAAFAGIEEGFAPLLALTEGLTRRDVSRQLTTREVKVLSELEFFQGFLRLKVAVRNDTDSVITGATLSVDFNENVLRLHRVEPDTLRLRGHEVSLGVVNTAEKVTLALYFDPQICTETTLECLLRYRDARGQLESTKMKPRRAEVVCPIFFTVEHANTGMLRRLVETELKSVDSKVFRIAEPGGVRFDRIFEGVKEVVAAHDVRSVRDLVSFKPFHGEAWFYGQTKVKKHRVVIRASVYEDTQTVEFFAASESMAAVTGLLAEFYRTLKQLSTSSLAGIRFVAEFDPHVKAAVASKSRLGEAGTEEAGS